MCLCRARVRGDELRSASVEFVKVDETNKDEIARLEKLNVLIKEKHIPIANLGLHKPTQVAAKVQAKLRYKFTVTSHTTAWQHFNVRPGSGAANPEATDSKYCVYDAAHEDYLYTDVWVESTGCKMPQRERLFEVRTLRAGHFAMLKGGNLHGLMNATDEDIHLFMFGGYD